ncbi:nuclear transport factor 2 family protein [Kribbella sp. NBC_01484]|uniref:nuclear transport factor 2 family protein n=1 Tax=Kribbella sp. NBC_01484 TaxID=2903579 RepID=UPI002E34E401|nr:nuclear transport factor 2 family protein [Kribbella sp. NBC_01484]
MDHTLERNKQTVLDFYEIGLNQKDFDQAATLIGSRYVQHNPRIADGIDGFEAFLATLRQDFPDLRAEVKRIFADGEYVVAHVYGVRVPGQPGTAIVDIFRLDADGKIVEHWDVMQPVPDTAANQNGMF